MLHLLAVPLTAFAVSALVGRRVVAILHRIHFDQSILEYAPTSHRKKSGTPTMGGLLMVLSLVLALLAWAPFTRELAMALLLALGHGLIGFADDYIKVVLRRNLGLTPRQKLLLQFLLAGAYVFYAETSGASTRIWIPVLDVAPDIGPLYYALVFLLLVGTCNAVNLTDGVDGLVSSVSVPPLAAFAAISYLGGDAALAQFALGLMGACLGFLLFNWHPAKVFMGDTGSLALGGGIAALAMLTHTELLLILLGGVYVAEAVSVILQVASFKSRGKRIFRMAPVHHHFELGGWDEVRVVKSFALASLLFSALGLGIWLKAFC